MSGADMKEQNMAGPPGLHAERLMDTISSSGLGVNQQPTVRSVQPPLAVLHMVGL